MCGNEEKYDGWKTSISLKLAFSLPHIIDTTLLISINHSIFIFLSKIQYVLDTNFCNLYGQVQQRSYSWLKGVLANKAKFKKIDSFWKRETSQSDFSIECGTKLAYKGTPKIIGWKIVIALRPSLFKVI